MFLAVFVHTFNKHCIVHLDDALQRHFSELAFSVTASAGIHRIDLENPMDDMRHAWSIEHVVHHGLICRPDGLLKKVPPE